MNLVTGSFTLSALQNYYVGKVRQLFLFLHRKKWPFLANASAALLIEPLSTFFAAYLMQKGLNKKKFSNLNPISLSKKQLKHSPVLLIHGDHSNSSIFAPLIEQITRDSPHKPIFTIELSSADGIVSAKNHLHILLAKVKEIEALYPSFAAVKISFIGHSSGGDVLGPLIEVMLQENMRPGAMIKIGSIFKESEAKEFRCYSHGIALEIVGTKDIFEGARSFLPTKLVVVTGHLGLLFHKSVLQRVGREIISFTGES